LHRFHWQQKQVQQLPGEPISITAVTASVFTGVTLTGSTQTTTSQIDTFDITDPSGSGAG
jgi:hypothetical protein